MQLLCQTYWKMIHLFYMQKLIIHLSKLHFWVNKEKILHSALNSACQQVEMKTTDSSNKTLF